MSTTTITNPDFIQAIALIDPKATNEEFAAAAALLSGAIDPTDSAGADLQRLLHAAVEARTCGVMRDLKAAYERLNGTMDQFQSLANKDIEFLAEMQAAFDARPRIDGPVTLALLALCGACLLRTGVHPATPLTLLGMLAGAAGGLLGFLRFRVELAFFRLRRRIRRTLREADELQGVIDSNLAVQEEGIESLSEFCTELRGILQQYFCAGKAEAA